MFDIFCHKITFVFQDTQVDVTDLIDLGKAATTTVTTTVRKQGLVDKLTAILDRRRNQRKQDRIEEERERKQDREDVAKMKVNAKASHKKER